jgi:hypothetical protein
LGVPFFDSPPSNHNHEDGELLSNGHVNNGDNDEEEDEELIGFVNLGEEEMNEVLR